jgi:hypothetical protein
MSSDLTPRTSYPSSMVDEFARLRGSAMGRRLFILGSGPSAGEIDLERLRGELTVSVNHFGLHPRIEGIAPTYHIVADPAAFDPAKTLFFEETLETLTFLDRTPTRLLLPFEFSGAIQQHPRYLAWNPLLWRYGGDPTKDVDFSRPVPTYGQNVLNVCLMFALHLGASEVHLIGFDNGGVVSRFGMTPHFYEQRAISKAAEAYFTDEDLERCMYNHLRQLHSLRRMADEAGTALFSCARKGTFRMFPVVDFEEIPGIPPSPNRSRSVDSAKPEEFTERGRDGFLPVTHSPRGEDLRALRATRKNVEEGAAVEHPGIDALLGASLHSVGHPRGGCEGAEALARVIPFWSEFVEAGRVEPIAAQLSAWLPFHPEHVDLHLLAARCAFLQGRRPDAKAHLETLRGFWPWSADVEVLSAEIALAEMDFATSFRHIKEAIERDNEAPRLFATVKKLERSVQSNGAGAPHQWTRAAAPGAREPTRSGVVPTAEASDALRSFAEAFHALRGQARGRRVFLFGPGRSAGEFDLALARDDLTITMDDFGLHERIEQLAPTFHMVADPLRWEGCTPEEWELHLRGLDAVRASGARILMPSSGLQGRRGAMYRDREPLLYRVGGQVSSWDFSTEVAPWARNPLNAGLMFCLHLMAQDVVLVGLEDDLLLSDPGGGGRDPASLGQKTSMNDQDRGYALLREQAILHREALRAGMSISIASPSGSSRRYPHVEYSSLFVGTATKDRVAAAQGGRPC